MVYRKQWRFKSKRKKAPLLGRIFRRQLGLEQLCDECSRPYLEKPAADPIEKFVSGSVVASVFIEQRFGKTNFYVQIGRNATDGRQMFICQMLSSEHLEDAAKVVAQAHKFIRGQKPVRLVSRK
jgi:hypothetical protein